MAGVTSLLAQSNNRPSAEQYQQAAQAHFQQQLRLANAGDPAAQFTLADMYRNGVGTEVNDTEARQWIEKSAHGGYLEAMLTLADELNRDQKYSDAVVWFRKAAEKGDTRGKAEFWLGVYYEEGDGVLTDPQEAFRWYSKAAEKNYLAAIENLAIMYVGGEGVSRDYSKAMQLYQRSVEMGSEKGMLGIALLFFNGQGVERDHTKAREWLLQASEAGEDQAQFMLGYMLMQGIGGVTDKKEGMKWIRMSARRGYEPAIMLMAAAIMDGVPGGDETLAESKESLRPLAEKGEKGAEFLMGLAEQKSGNYQQAREWFEKAILKGDGFSAHGLAALYEHGYGVPKDLKRAGELYTHSVNLQEEAVLLNDAAWFFATAEDPKYRNPELAFRYASRAVQLSEDDNAAYIDTLAEAYYVNHDYKQAVALEERALKLEPDRPEFKKSLARFKAGLTTLAANAQK